MTAGPTEILLVEDDPMTRLIMRSLLQESGFVAVEAEAGAIALDILRKEPPALVVLDYYLPDMNGTEVIDALTAMDIRLPIIVVTGYDDQELKDKVLKAGASRFVHKDSACAYLRQLPVIISEMLRTGAESSQDPAR